MSTGTFLDKPELTEPNDLGYQFGICKGLTEYANREQLQYGGASLPALVGWKVLEVWKDNERVTYLLIDENGRDINEAPGFEGMACKIDMYKTSKMHDA